MHSPTISVKIATFQTETLPTVDGRRDGDVLRFPVLEARMRRQEAFRAARQRPDGAGQFFGIAPAGAEADALFVLIDGHEVDLD